VRSVIVLMLFAVSTFAQEQPGAVAACGSREAFEVELDRSQHTLVQPEPGKARVYFVQDIGAVNCLGRCGTIIGLDGVSVGANKQNSYFSVSVEPGEHHVCVCLSQRFSPHTVALRISLRKRGRCITSARDPFWRKTSS
jgi:hypothetical protein